uniref:Syndecan n=1 Tax=Magallana gigas TaxID=29159 RepID=K1PIE7_MAGGI
MSNIYPGLGSGVGPTLVDDEDVEDISGESSGSGQLSTKTHHEFSTTTTTRSLTACEQLRLSAENTTVDAYRPKCTLNGEYEPLQCHRRMFNKECWCVDQLGNEVTGTRMMQPHVPDCITGIGLKPCVLQLLKRRQGLLGVYHPRCTIDGEFEKIQCHGSACWCVDQGGIERPETRVYQPEVPNCIHNNFGIHDGDVYDETGKDENRGIIGKEENEGRTDKQDSSPIVYIMGRPGLLAAVIGGAVVALLLTILLVMFIVYRMRKKDEGSYPLDEQKYTNYSYMKAPDKEFYA